MTNSDTLGLNNVDATETCIACYEETECRAKCCKAAICTDCYNEWLKAKRQCMHCKADQCDFDRWVNEFRIDNDNIADIMSNIFANPEEVEVFTYTDTSIVGLLEQLRQERDAGNTGEIDINISRDIPDPTQPFLFEFGVRIIPNDDAEEEAMVLMSTIDYQGNTPEIFERIQQILDRYAALQEDDGENS